MAAGVAPRRLRRRPRPRFARAAGAADRALLEAIKESLASAPKGMRVVEIAQAVKAAGYKSTSKNFYNMVAATVREPDFKKVVRGVYKLA